MILAATGRPAGGSSGGNGATMSAEAGEAGLPGQAVYADASGRWRLAQADAEPGAEAYGLLVDGMTATFLADAVNAGELEGTLAEWDAATGETGGLTPGARYFLSTTVAGRITSTLPTSGYRTIVGRAITATKMAVDMGECVKFAS